MSASIPPYPVFWLAKKSDYIYMEKRTADETISGTISFRRKIMYMNAMTEKQTGKSVNTVCCNRIQE